MPFRFFYFLCPLMVGGLFRFLPVYLLVRLLDE